VTRGFGGGAVGLSHLGVLARLSAATEQKWAAGSSRRQATGATGEPAGEFGGLFCIVTPLLVIGAGG